MFDIHPNWRDPHYDIITCRDCGKDLKKEEEEDGLCKECEKNYIDE